MTKLAFLIATVVGFLSLVGIVLISDVGASTTLGDWSEILGVPAERLEVCLNESLDDCVHVRDGELITVTVPAGYTVEGWDGVNTIPVTPGSVTFKVFGATVRKIPSTPTPTPTPMPSPTPVVTRIFLPLLGKNTPLSPLDRWPVTSVEAEVTFGGSTDRWVKACLDEPSFCWRLTDGQLTELSIPSFAWVEGWDGLNTISRRDGPVTVQLVGATVRPK